MGLDLVEFVMEIEEKFNLDISDPDAQELTTPRKVIDYVASRVAFSPSAKRNQTTCPSQHAFYRLRRTFMERLGVERRQVRPDSPVAALVPRENRRALWASLQQDLVLPELRRPALVCWLMFFLLLGMTVTSLAYLHGRGMEIGVALACAFIVAGVSAWTLVRLTERWQLEIPRQLKVKGLVRYLVPFARIPPPKDGMPWTREQIKFAVFVLVKEQFGIGYGDFDEDSRFTEDIGAD